MGWRDWAGVGTDAIATYLDYTGKKGMQEDSRAHLALQENARQESMATLQQNNIFATAAWMFPGLLGPSAGAAGNFQNLASSAVAQHLGPTGSTLAGGQAPSSFTGAPPPSGAPTPTPTSAPQPQPGQPAPTENPAVATPVQLEPPTPHVFQPSPMPVPPNRQVPARATGGSLQPGQQTLVGEQGPEVVTSPGGGTVAPGPVQGPTPGPTTPPLPNPVDPIITGDTGTGLMAPAGTGGDGRDDPLDGRADSREPPVDTGIGVFGEQMSEKIRQARSIPQNQPSQFDSFGEAVVGQNEQLARNPGDLTSAPYERQQEEANRALQMATMAVSGQMSQSGVDPNSPMGQSLMMAATAAANRQRSEAGRDFDLASEALRREDIDRATGAYINMLQTVFGLQGMRAQAAGGQGFTPISPINPYSGMATNIAQLGVNLQNYGSKDQESHHA